jgi:DNA-binding XRE family transcriptional regulator
MAWNKDTVRELRQKLKLTQMEFARTLGCRQQTISEWEQGIYVPANAYSKLLDSLALQTEMSRPFLHQKKPDPVEQKIKEHVTVARLSAQENFQMEAPQDAPPPFDPAVD